MNFSTCFQSKVKPISVVIASISIATFANANSLVANGALQTLIGGASDSYQHTIDPATLHDTAIGADTLSDTRGSFVGPSDPDLHATATASSSARFGLLTETSSVSSKGYAAEADAGDGPTVAAAYDSITIHGSGLISLTLNSLYIGQTSISPDANASAVARQQVYVSPDGFVDNSEIVSLSDVYSNTSSFDHLQSGTITVHDGETFYMFAELHQDTSIDPLNAGLDRPELRTNSASTAANLNYWIGLSSGATLTSDSGYSYGAPAVPEPAPLLAMGLGLFALIRRRKN